MTKRLIALLLALAALTPIPASAQEREVPYWATIKAPELYMRKGPSHDFKIDWVYKRPGLPLKVLRVAQGWRLVIDPDGTKGWVSASLLSPDRGVIVIGEGLAALRAGPDDSAKLRWNAQTGVIGKLRECDLGWCKIDVGGRVGWVRAERLWGAGEP
ncbi:MAG: hypothetical protein KJZ64_02110 [Sphingomonadaceae bacterium]|nr:hypothetical protein [Sphingomonadaceae bacterium]